MQKPILKALLGFFRHAPAMFSRHPMGHSVWLFSNPVRLKHKQCHM